MGSSGLIREGASGLSSVDSKKNDWLKKRTVYFTAIPHSHFLKSSKYFKKNDSKILIFDVDSGADSALIDQSASKTEF